MKLVFIFLALFALPLAYSEEITLVFNAVLVSGTETRFGLSLQDGREARWLSLGEKYDGYVLLEYDDKTRVLEVAKGDAHLLLRMSQGAVDELRRKPTMEAATQLLQQMHFEELLTKTLDQQRRSAVGISREMLRQIGADVPEDVYATFQEKLLGAVADELDPSDLKGPVASAYTEIFNEEELKAMSAFYSTPVGQSLLGKQPLLQQKMNEIMLPCVLRAMPRIQKLTDEFGEQVRLRAGGK